jgi:hypothetical protein
VSRRNTRKGVAAALAAAAAALGAACQSAPQPVSVMPVLAERSVTNCPLREPMRERGWLLIDDATQWAARIDGGEAAVLGAPVAWPDARVLVVGLGPQATGGHRVGLAAAPRLVAGELQLAARHVTPPEGAVLTQAFTAPCLLLALPRAGWQPVRLAWVR